MKDNFMYEKRILSMPNIYNLNETSKYHSLPISESLCDSVLGVLSAVRYSLNTISGDNALNSVVIYKFEKGNV